MRRLVQALIGVSLVLVVLLVIVAVIAARPRSAPLAGSVPATADRSGEVRATPVPRTTRQLIPPTPTPFMLVTPVAFPTPPPPPTGAVVVSLPYTLTSSHCAPVGLPPDKVAHTLPLEPGWNLVAASIGSCAVGPDL